MLDLYADSFYYPGPYLLWCRFPTLAKSLLAQQSYALSEPASVDHSILCPFTCGSLFSARCFTDLQKQGFLLEMVLGPQVPGPVTVLRTLILRVQHSPDL